MNLFSNVKLLIVYNLSMNNKYIFVFVLINITFRRLNGNNNCFGSQKRAVFTKCKYIFLNVSLIHNQRFKLFYRAFNLLRIVFSVFLVLDISTHLLLAINLFNYLVIKSSDFVKMGSNNFD